MQIIRINGELGVYSWTTGFKNDTIFLNLDNEAKKNPEAVINRLLLENREEEAERILEAYV